MSATARVTRILSHVGQSMLIDSVLEDLQQDPLHVRNLTITEIRHGRRIVIETDDSTAVPVLTQRID